MIGALVYTRKGVSYSDVHIELCDGKYVCSCCSIAPRVKSIVTTGYEAFNLPPCDKCDGSGCDSCLMFSDSTFESPDGMLDHIYQHLILGDIVPMRAIEMIRELVSTPGGVT